MNRPTNMLDAAGTTKYTYTGFGALQTEDGPWDNDTVSFGYDNARRRNGLSLAAPNASAWTQSYGYDNASRLSTLTSPAGAFAYAYDALRSILVGNLALPNGSYIANAFDTSARLLSTELRNSANETINAHIYQLDPANERTNLTRVNVISTNASHYLATNSIAYRYDKISQLTNATGTEADGTPRHHEQFTYIYDAAGNLNYRTNDYFSQTFNLNSLNQIANITRDGNFTVAGGTAVASTNVSVSSANAILYSDATFARTNKGLSEGFNFITAFAKDSYGRVSSYNVGPSLPGSADLRYDANGNLLTNRNIAVVFRIYEYDDENQLIRVTSPSEWRTEFVYDGRMRRRIRREYGYDSSANSYPFESEVRYVYDGNLVIQERDANNLPLVTYTHGKDLSGTLEGAGGIGGFLARTDMPSAAHAYYQADGNGNVTCMLNTNQFIVAKYLYDPFGYILAKSGVLADANLYRFSSKEFHFISGLVYYGYRFYDPNLQRWLNRDPIGQYEARSLYGFARNDPVYRFDTDGRLVPAGPLVLPCLPAAATALAASAGGFAAAGIVAAPIVSAVVAAGVVGLLYQAGSIPCPVTYPNPLTNGQNAPPKIIKCPLPKKNPECSWTGRIVEQMPGIKECEYNCEDGTTIYRSLTPGGTCADVITKFEPMRPW